MAIFNDNIGLNIAVFAIMLAADITVLICCFLDNFRKIKPFFNFFILWVMFEILFLAANITVFILRYYSIPFHIVNAVAAVSYIAVSLAYAAAGGLIIGIINDKTPVPKIIRYLGHFGTLPMVIVFLIFIPRLPIPYHTVYGFITDIPFAELIYANFFIYLCFLGYLVIHYRKSIIMPEPVLLIMMLVIPQLLNLQNIWIFVPSTVARTLFISASFFRIWQERVKRISSEQARLAKADVKLATDKIDIMLSKINPDFLLSTLETVARLCKTNPASAEKLTLEFSSYLRQTIHSLRGSEFYPFSHEFKYLQSYFYILQNKTGGKIKCEAVSPNGDFRIPALSVYTLVEKAEKQLPYGGSIYLSAIVNGRHSTVKICLSGAGIRFMKKPVSDVSKMLSGIGGMLTVIKSENSIDYTLKYVESAI